MTNDVEEKSPEGATLDQLAAELGAPTPVAVRLAFRGADEAWMLRQGQSIASEIILKDGAAFVNATRAVWAQVPDEKRRLIIGYTPALDAVAVQELIVLRGASHRYDLLAQGAGLSIARRRQEARDAFASGVTLRLSVHQTLRDMLGAAHPIIVSLDAAMKPADTAEILANGLDGVADTLGLLRNGDDAHDADPELLEELDAAQLDDALIDAMHASATKVRDTATLSEAKPQDLAAAQRALDLQDGRALQVIGMILRAFRRARKSDPTLLVPDFGDLSRIFGSPNSGRSDDEPAPPQPAPPQPAPPQPAPVG